MSFGGAPRARRSELVYFRHRIGPGGAGKLLAVSVALHGEKAKGKEVVMDMTAQEKAISAEECDRWRQWVDEQVAELLQDLKGVLNDLERLHQKLLARSLQPSMAYTVVESLWQHRVSPVSMRTAGLVAGFLCAAYLGVVMIAIAWRCSGRSSRPGRPA